MPKRPRLSAVSSSIQQRKKSNRFKPSYHYKRSRAKSDATLKKTTSHSKQNQGNLKKQQEPPFQWIIHTSNRSKINSNRSKVSCVQPNSIDYLRYELTSKKLKLVQISETATQRPIVHFGDYEIKTLHLSPFPPDYYSRPEFFICEFCLKSSKTLSTAHRHKSKCAAKCPPGNEIYRQGSISIFEVDGRSNKMYCLNLCLMTKLFLDHKTLFYDVEPFLFYIMTETDQYGCHLIGYFSKEKRSLFQFNVSCILVLPVHQRKGYGQYLIDFSYLLTRRENTVGTPEKPLSTLGALGYQRYWDYTILKYLASLDGKSNETIWGIAMQTGMTPDDVVATLQKNKLLIYHPLDRKYTIHVHPYTIQQRLLFLNPRLEVDSNMLK